MISHGYTPQVIAQLNMDYNQRTDHFQKHNLHLSQIILKHIQVLQCSIAQNHKT